MLEVSLDELAGLPARDPGVLTADELALLKNYRQIADDAIRGFVFNATKDAPKK